MISRTNQSRTTSSKPGSDLVKAKEKEMFDKARGCLDPVSKFFANFYSERKLVVFMMLYASALLVVFGHYALTTGNTDFWMPNRFQALTGEELSPWTYWFLTRFPMIESGGVNACLLLYAILPLTMSKFTSSKIGDSVIGNFIPFRRLIRVHTICAWTLLLFFTWLLIFFLPMIFTIKGVIGYIPPQLQFDNQMFITGYMIYSCMLAIWISSALRHRIRWEIFYYTHQLALVLFVLLIVHTLGKFRSELNQAYPWVAPPFLFYICDRLAMRLFHKFRTPMVSVTLVHGASCDDSSKAMILRIRRPVLFSFKAGQYAYLRLHAIDSTWHPFSIMSDPDSDNLEFFVGVVGNESSWTAQLYESLKTRTDKDTVQFEVLGPYGNSLGKSEDYSHVLAFGSGTGFVPVVSLIKNHMNRLLRLDPEAHCRRLDENYGRVAEQQLALEQYNGSLASKVLKGLRLQARTTENEQSEHLKTTLNTLSDEDTTRSRMMKMKLLTVHATRSFYAKVWLTLLPMLGVAAIGFTISFNTVPQPSVPTPWSMYHMRLTIMAVSVLVQFLYAVIALFFWNADSLAVFLDMMFIILTPFADWIWCLRIIRDGHLDATDILLFGMLMAYFVGRLWWAAVKPSSPLSWRAASQIPGVTALESVSGVWVVRQAEMVAQLLPDINDQYEQLVAAWGQERAKQVCRIQIYVTEKSQRKIDALTTDISETALYKAGCIYFGRPNMENLVEEHTLDLVSTRQNTYSLLSYCGSVGMSSELQRVKVNLDLVKAITGNQNHQMEFVSECHGGPQQKIKSNSNENNVESITGKNDGEVAARESTEVASPEAMDFDCEMGDLEEVSLDDRKSAVEIIGPRAQRGLTARSTILFASSIEKCDGSPV